MALSFDEASRRYTEKFPGKSLLSFKSFRAPCSIQCEIHGRIDVVSYKSVIESKHGCPVCGHQSSKEIRQARLSGRATTAEVLARASHDPLSKSLTAILDAWPQTWAACHDVLHSQMRKGEIIEEVERLLLAYDKQVRTAGKVHVELGEEGTA